MSNLYNIQNKAFEISNLAIQAIMYEVSCYPSPGLVSPVSNGAHMDMDYYTFIDSTSALIKYLILCVQKGLEEGENEDIFRQLRIIGIEAEKEMYIKTKGVNTHKGMLFLMGISCAAVGVALRDNKSFSELREIIKDMTKGIVNKDFSKLEGKNFNDLSYGEKLYLKYNIKGIRGEVEAGLPLVFDYSLSFYKSSSDLNINARLVHTLMGIMQYSEDTNIIHRHSIKVLKEVNEKAKKIMTLGGMYTKEGREAVENMTKEFIERNISPGGAADLLAITVFFSLVEEYMKKLS